MTRDRDPSHLPQPPPPEARRSVAWRCASCGTLKIHDDLVEKPASCSDCGKNDLVSFEIRSSGQDPNTASLLERITLIGLLARRQRDS
jgi:uncharacterized protein (DUF983 family)